MFLGMENEYAYSPYLSLQAAFASTLCIALFSAGFASVPVVASAHPG